MLFRLNFTGVSTNRCSATNARAALRRMSEPCHRVPADPTVVFGDVRPFDIRSQPEKDTHSALVGALGENDFIAFMEGDSNGFSAHHVYLVLSVYFQHLPCG